MRLMHVASPDLLERVGTRVRSLRKAQGLTARETADRAGLSLRFFSQLESGRANIAIGRLAAVAAALSVPLSRLVEEPAPGDAGAPARAAIALLGLRGAGKSTLGPRLARALGLRFVELDEAIEEAAGLSLTDVFSVHGEAYYRRLALQCLRDVLAGKPAVIALPGGIVHDETCFQLVLSECTTAWIKARPADHMARVLEQGDRRPIAGRPNAMAELRAILAAREPLYSRAQVTVDTSRKDEAQALAALVAALEREGWERAKPRRA